MLALLSFRSFNLLPIQSNKSIVVIVEDPTSSTLLTSSSLTETETTSATRTGGGKDVLIAKNEVNKDEVKSNVKQFFRNKAIVKSTSTTSDDKPLPICHSAKVLVTLMNGSTSSHPINNKKKKTLINKNTKLNQPRLHPLIPTSPKISTPTLTIDTTATTTTNNKKKEIETKCIPQLDSKQLKKLKKSLVKPSEARKIISDLKRIQLIDNETSNNLLEGNKDCKIISEVNSECIGYALPPLSSSSSTSTSSSIPSIFTLLTPTSIISSAVNKSGTFELAGEITGALIHSNGANITMLVAPEDTVGIFIYWWGYELSLPVKTLNFLAGVHSVQGTFFAFLQAFSLSGGAPQLTPLIKYISSYLDMEWAAIISQNKGNGVILAATWILPVAIIPRPWDFALPPSNKSI